MIISPSLQIAIKYMIFAGLAIITNIGAQEICIILYPGEGAILLSVACGTVAGLLVKFELDRRYIFFHKTISLSNNSRLFILYTFVSILTTLIFWGFEFTFHILFQTKMMRYTGAVIGLVIGYYIKYRLDKKYVFTGNIDALP